MGAHPADPAFVVNTVDEAFRISGLQPIVRDHARDDEAQEGHRRPGHEQHEQEKDVGAFSVAILDLDFTQAIKEDCIVRWSLFWLCS